MDVAEAGVEGSRVDDHSRHGFAKVSKAVRAPWFILRALKSAQNSNSIVT
jgi:hypothetical protein